MPRKKFVAVRTELNKVVLARDEEILGLLCALVTGDHVLLLGPTGTAKSLLAEALCKRIEGAGYFKYLMTKFTSPEEVFGMIKMSGFEQDRYERKTEGKLPEAHVAFLDEIFKASSSIRDSLLTCLNEREYDNEGRHPIPLRLCVAASNELPNSDDSGAFYDRFMVRFWVEPLKTKKQMNALLRLKANGALTQLTLDELNAAAAQMEDVTVSDSVLDRLIALWRTLDEDHNIRPSDRRLVRALRLMKANAWLRGAERVGAPDFSILCHVCWDKPQDRDMVRTTIRQMAQPGVYEAEEVIRAALDRVGDVPDLAANSANRQDVLRKGDAAQNAVKSARGEVEKLLKSADNMEKDAINSLLAELERGAKLVENKLVKAFLGPEAG